MEPPFNSEGYRIPPIQCLKSNSHIVPLLLPGLGLILSSVMICWRMSPMSCSGWQLLWHFLLLCGSSTSSPVKPIRHNIWWALFSIPPMWHQCGGKDGSRVTTNKVLSSTFHAHSKLKDFPQKRKGKSGVASAARILTIY